MPGPKAPGLGEFECILTLGMPPGVGVLTCRRQFPCVSPLNLAWGSEDVVDRCFTHNFMYLVIKRWNVIAY